MFQLCLWDVTTMLKVPTIKSWPLAFWQAVKRFDAKNGWVMSSHIAMSMMLALFPFVLFTVALTGAVANILSQDVALDDLIELVFGAWPEAVSKPILTELYAVLQTSGTGLMTFGGVLALYFASNGVNAVRVAMVQAYHDRDARPFWLSRLLCLGLVILGGIGILAAALFEIILPLYVQHLAEFFPTFPVSPHWQRGINGILVAVLPLIAVLLCHAILPGRIHRFSHILPGALLTVTLWWLAGIGFAFYVGSVAQYSATYAGLAGAMAAMIFLYVNAVILILGAEFNGVLIDMAEDSSPDARLSNPDD